MSNDPTPPELAALFEAERGYEEAPSPEIRARIVAGVRSRLGSPDGGAAPGGSPPAPAGPGGGGASIATSKAISGMLATFVLGGLLGAAIMHREEPAPPIAASSPSPSLVTSPSVVGPPIEPASALPTMFPSAPSASAAPPRPSSEPADDARSAAAERALLDSARIALASGEPAKALEVATRHAREYPHGRLAEEREAIAVRALVKVGRYDEARARAARFNALYPRSTAAAAVNAAIGSIP